jgi:hypothetical protein
MLVAATILAPARLRYNDPHEGPRGQYRGRVGLAVVGTALFCRRELRSLETDTSQLGPGAAVYAASVVDHERCEACDFDGGRFDDAALLEALRSLGPQWRARLADAGDDLRKRPALEVWSAIEYAAHSRDITALHVFGVEQALTLDEPSFPGIADDLVDSAAADYNASDPAMVADALDEHATRLAQLAQDAGPDAWTRGLTIGENRSEVRRLLEHALHDSVHHLEDVDRGLAHLRTPR